jgi:hypothetical protein
VSLQDAAERALGAFLRAMNGPASHQRAELALTLHMLEAVAPRFFVAQQLGKKLDASLEALTKVPPSFGPKVGADEAMARLDALYLRQVRGLKPRAFKPAEVKAAVKRSGEQIGPLWQWLMGELAAPLGVEARLPLQTRWPFRADRVSHLYHLTHVVMIDTAYLMKPLSRGLTDELVELYGALDGLAARHEWDLLGECAFCLHRAGTKTPDATAALLAAQRKDGSFAEAGSSDRSAAHCTAVGVLALAGALDLEAPAP